VVNLLLDFLAFLDLVLELIGDLWQVLVEKGFDVLV
jgi:hypothetical protein